MFILCLRLRRTESARRMGVRGAVAGGVPTAAPVPPAGDERGALRPPCGAAGHQREGVEDGVGRAGTAVGAREAARPGKWVRGGG